jgi:predicted metal-dependent phosphoesterase TrpH
LKADLHIHSTVSDGSDTIGHIIDAAKNAGLDIIAFTDHDTVSHFEQIPDVVDIKVLGGVEISSVYRKTDMRAHLSGSRIQKPDIIAALTQPLLEARNDNSEKQVEVLIKSGLRIDADKLARADGKYIYKQHIMDWLVATGQAPDMFGDFYQKTFKQGGICAFDIEYIDVLEAVRTIKEANGLAVLAHPGQQQNFGLIPGLIGAGLDGLELNHHSHTENDREIIRDYAKRYGLFFIGVSDYHGNYESRRSDVGSFLSDESGLNAIC